jgi:hypothetical protein
MNGLERKFDRHLKFMNSPCRFHGGIEWRVFASALADHGAD